MIKREVNAERKRKSRANMSAGKIAEVQKYDRERKHLSHIAKKNKNCFKPVPARTFKILQLKKNTTKKEKNCNVENFVMKNLVTENLVTKNLVTEKNLEEKMASCIEKSCLASCYLRKMVELKKNKKKLELEKVKKQVLEKLRSR